MPDWNPQQYLQFKDERTQPVRDLIARLGPAEHVRILDIGCGPGNSTARLKARYGAARITGIDFSQNMIERAKADCPGPEFLVADAAGDLSPLGRFDLIFANASLQWLPGHGALLRRYAGMLQSGGVMAMQIPQFDRMPACRAIDEAASAKAFAPFFEGFASGMHFYPEGYYYDVLSGLFDEVTMWSTDYFHVMESPEALIEWLRSTGLKPYIEQVPKQFQPAFIESVLEELKKSYPPQKNGRVLFPFQRLFFIARGPSARL